MQPFKNSKPCTIIGSAMLGGFYGLVGALTLNSEVLSPWGLVVPFASGAALFASAASALCRVYETLSLIRKSGQLPNDDTLCYRGVCYFICDLSTGSDPQKREITAEDPPTTSRLAKPEFLAVSATKNASQRPTV